MLRRALLLLSVSLIVGVFATAVLPTKSLAATPSNITVSQSAFEKAKARTKVSWPWYVTRASGLAAATLLVILIMSGIGQLTGLSFGFIEPLVAWATHRAIGIAFGCLVLVHITALLFDTFVPFSILDILVPLHTSYRAVDFFGLHVGSYYVALGVMSFYLMLLIVGTSLLIINKQPRVWKLLHFLSYLLVLSIFFHALMLGTDFASGILRVLWIAGGVSVIFAVLYRLWRARTI